MRNAIVYCRISEDREDTYGGVDNQEGMCLRLADELGWQVVRVYVDNDISAASGKHRKWYEQMKEDLRNGVADAVLAAHPDRLHRRPVELEEFINLCENRDVVVRTRHAGSIDLSTSAGKMVARMLGAAARAEVDRMIERGRDHKDKMAAAGAWRGGPRPFGYEADGVTIRETESLIIKSAVTRFLSGESLNMLTKELNDDGVVTTFGKRWTTAGLRTVLRRARNAGLVEQSRTGQTFPATWPAIIGEDQWRRVNTILDDPARRTHNRGATPTHLGTNRYLCGACGDGTAMKGSSTHVAKHEKGVSRAGTPTYYVYRCKNYNHLVRASAPIDSYVREAVREGLRDGYALRVLVADAGCDTGALHDRAQAIRQEIEELAQLKVQGLLTLGQVVTMTEDLRQELTEIQGKLVGSSLTSSALVGVADDPEPVRRFDEAPLSTQRAILQAMYVITIVRPEAAGRRATPPDPDNPFPRFDERSVQIERAVDLDEIHPKELTVA